ncbi:hypothetical protein LCGC14_0622980 [marine sediment metagenome]|uniref:Uncharacterized protein n=1 Tax=marine sediment metagenome TaxID=412755 RepID=A0A0F9TQN3_9ZZZZ
MPFTGPEDTKLPSNVKGESKTKRAQWVKVFNAAFKNCQANGGTEEECEKIAFKFANGVLKNSAQEVAMAAREMAMTTRELSSDYLKKLRELLFAADLPKEFVAEIVRKARAHAGGKGKKEVKNFGELYSGNDGADGRFYFANSAAEPPDTINVFPIPGTYKHPLYGAIKVSRDTSKEMVKNFNDGVYQERVPLDAEHETKLSGAVGWITHLKMNADGSVDADVEWNERGEEMIRDDRFKFISPEWFDNWSDPATGEEFEQVLVGAALTTRPFFKEGALRPLVATEAGKLWDVEHEGDDPELWTLLALELPNGMSAEDLQEKIRKTVGDSFPGLKGDHGLWVANVFNDKAIISTDDGFFEVKFAIDSDGQVSFSGQPMEVERTTKWSRVSATDTRGGQSGGQNLEVQRRSRRKASPGKGREDRMTELLERAKELESDLDSDEGKSWVRSMAEKLGFKLSEPKDGGNGNGDDDDEEDNEDEESSNDDEDNEDSEDNKGEEDAKTGAEVAVLQGALKASEKRATAAETRLGTLETESLTRRLRDIILGRDEGSIRKASEEGKALHPMVGDAGAKMSILVKLGEGTKEFNTFVATEREHARQLHESEMFSELGTDSTGEPVTASPKGEIDRMVAAARAKDPELSEEDAIARVASENPKLYDAYDKSVTGRKGVHTGTSGA